MDPTHHPGDGSVVRSRHIPAVIRERVLERAGYRCEHSNGNGVRCSQRTGLNIDHVQPYALEGEHDEKNLRALCSVHNLWYAKRVYGEAFIEGKIQEAREGRLESVWKRPHRPGDGAPLVVRQELTPSLAVARSTSG